VKTLLPILWWLSVASVSGHDVVRSVFGGQKTLDIFLSAKKVMAERLHLKERAIPRGLANYTRDSATTLSQAQIQALHRLFTDTSSYTWNYEQRNGQKLCVPNYGVLLTFHSERSVVYIALCFECDLFAICVGDTPNPQRVNSEEDLDRIRPQLVVLVQALFPKDAQIRALDPHIARPN
jgi:hypothetical protein